MKRLSGILFAIAFLLVMTAQPVFAQGAPAGDVCDTWFTGTLECMKPAILKGAQGVLNKQVGDVGTASFSMGQLVITGIGICDETTESQMCPKGVSFQRSAIAGLSTAAIAMYQNPPADTMAFVSDVGRTLGFMPRAQAQGIGFSGMSALLGLWKAFRNIAYALLAIIMIVVGFMVMFRKKIDPKTVVTVQNAIPRIVVALLLVTFSYAIVGVMIDLMYLAIVLAVSVITSVSPELGSSVGLFTALDTNVSTSKVSSILFDGGMWGLLRYFLGSGLGAYDDIAASLTHGLDPKAIAGWLIVPGVIGMVVGGGKGAITGLLSAPVLLAAILVLVLLFGFIRLVFLLIDAYINIIISLLTAPFQLMMEAIPGSNAFNGWFRNLLSKIIVFPLTAVLLLVAAILTSQSVSTTVWAPPLLSSGGGAYGMSGIIGLGMLLVIPSVVMSIQKALKAEPLIPGGVGAIVGPFGSGIGQLVQLGYQASFIASGFRHKPDTRTPLQTAREGAEKGLGSLSGGGGGH